MSFQFGSDRPRRTTVTFAAACGNGPSSTWKPAPRPAFRRRHQTNRSEAALRSDSFRVPGVRGRSADARGGPVRPLQLEARAEGLLPRRLEPRLRASPEVQEGDKSEDHLGHLACNVAFLVWAVKNGAMSQEDFNAPT